MRIPVQKTHVNRDIHGGRIRNGLCQSHGNGYLKYIRKSSVNNMAVKAVKTGALMIKFAL